MRGVLLTMRALVLGYNDQWVYWAWPDNFGDLRVAAWTPRREWDEVGQPLSTEGRVELL